ncbi:MAG: HPr(Ser) kinase/phosphatase [Candidatus Eiseniibacteriota bacterium]
MDRSATGEAGALTPSSKDALGSVQTLSAARLFEEQQTDLELEVLTESLSSRREVTVSDIHRPGMALMGFVENFLPERIQVLGQTELTYLAQVTEPEARAAIDRLFQFTMPCVMVAKGLDVPAYFLERANALECPVLRTPQSTTPFIHSLTAYLDAVFSPSSVVHGSLVDVYGVGLLLTGKSGIGKSECALDLVERGHRLVADDAVRVTRRHGNVLIGQGNQLLRHHMEIRGIGIIDVQSIFGIRSIRVQKRVEVQCDLRLWEPGVDYDRTGLDEQKTDILGLEIPLVIIPIVPGKNITVIAEVVALNYLTKAYGYHPAERLNRHLLEMMKRKSANRAWVREDTE